MPHPATFQGRSAQRPDFARIADPLAPATFPVNVEPNASQLQVALFWLANPRPLPRDRDALVVPANPNVRAIAVAQFDILVFVQLERSQESDARADLVGSLIRHAIQAGGSPEPEIAVQRYPGPRLPV